MITCAEFVADRTGVIEDDEVLDTEAARIEGLYGSQVAGVIVPSFGSWSIGRFAQGLGNTWGVGSAETDNGIVVIVDVGGRNTWVEFGDGLRDFPRDKARIADLGAAGFRNGDFDAGVLLSSPYKVLRPNAHHEYGSDGMLAAFTQFLDAGGCVVAPAGKMLGWRVVYGSNDVIEVRTYRRALIVGVADMFSGIDGVFMGSWSQAVICNSDHAYYGEQEYQALGVANHLIHPCKNQPFCYGQWQAQNSDHWLWQGSGLSNDDLFGVGRPTPFITPTYAVGHETDTWVPGMPLPGLAAGQQPVVLAEGVNFDPEGTGDAGGVTDLLDNVGITPTVPACEDYTASIIGSVPYVVDDQPPTKSGTILYFPHSGGGDVLVIGASATPWALESDAALSGLMRRALNCFAYDQGCGYSVYLPTVTAGP